MNFRGFDSYAQFYTIAEIKWMIYLKYTVIQIN
jgi:hypothetical protein